MSYQIQIQPETGLWLVTYNGRALGRAALPNTAISLARERVDAINNPVTGEGAGTLPALNSAVVQQLDAQAQAIQAQQQAELDAERRAREAQGSGAVSTGAVAAESAQANDSRSATQVPGTGAQNIGTDGNIESTASVTVPSNATAAVSVPVNPAAAPNTLPPGTTGTEAAVPGSTGGVGQIPSAVTPARSVDLLQAVPNSYTNIYIYQAITVTSIFNQGRFTQEIEGVQKFYNPAQTSAPSTSSRSAAAPDLAGTQAQVARQPQGALGESSSVSFAGSELGAYFNNGDTGGGAVNFTPTGLAQVLDRQAQTNTPIVADPGVAGRNVGDEFGFFVAPDDTTDLAPARKEPPTSNGGTVAIPAPATQTVGGGNNIQITQQIADLQAQLNVAIQRGDLTQVSRLNGLIATLETQLLRSNQGVTTNQANQNIAKER